MFKYKVLDVENNVYMAENVVVTQDNKLMTKEGVKVSAPFKIHPFLNLCDKKGKEVYIGDTFSIKLNAEDSVTEAARLFLDRTLISDFSFAPKEYDELIIQTNPDDDDQHFFWVLFKLNGEFIKNKDVFPETELTGSENEEYRAVPTDTFRVFRNKAVRQLIEVLYNCTDRDWVKLA